MTGGRRIHGRGHGAGGGGGGDTTPPSAPTGLIATTVSSSTINLDWTDSTDNVAVTGYNVYRNGTFIASTTVSNYVSGGLAASTTYSYTVKAFDAAGNLSAASNSASATTSSSGSTPTYTGPTPAIATRAQWDSAYNSSYPSGYNFAGDSQDNKHWSGSYMFRAFLQMARTYGITPTDYLARCVGAVNAWQADLSTNSGYRGWTFAGTGGNLEQGFLDTGGILAAIMEFCYVVLNDPGRFSAYTSTALTYLSRYAGTSNSVYPTILQFNGNQGGENLMVGPLTGVFLSAVNGQSWYKQSTYSIQSTKPNNQGALMGLASLFAYYAQQVGGVPVTTQYLTNASNCAGYLHAQINATSGMGSWGANKPAAGLCDFPYGCTSGEAFTEDSAHGHIQVRAMYAFDHFGLGGFSAANRTQLNGTLANVTASGQYITTYVDGSGGSIGTGIDSAHASVLANDWPDLANYANFDARMTKIVQGYNFNAGTNPAWKFLGWATIQRNLAGVSAY